MKIERVLVAEMVEGLIVGIERQGRWGWGEAVLPSEPGEAEEWLPAAWLVATRWLAPRIVGRWVSAVEDVRGRLASVAGFHRTKSAFIGAWNEVAGEFDATPQNQSAERPRAVRLPPWAHLDEALTTIGRLFEAGAALVKVPYTPDNDPNLPRAIRQVFPSEEFIIDGQERFDPSEHADFFYRLDDFMFTALEQPFPADSLWDHVQLSNAIHTPIWLHESLARPRLARQAVEMAPFGLTLDVPLLGGLVAATELLDIVEGAAGPIGVRIDPAGRTGRMDRAAWRLADDPRVTGPCEVSAQAFLSGEAALSSEAAETEDDSATTIWDETQLLAEAIRWAEIV